VQNRVSAPRHAWCEFVAGFKEYPLLGYSGWAGSDIRVPVGQRLNRDFAAANEELRRVLIVARREASLTQQELAAKLGKPQSFVSKYEQGERRLGVVEFLLIAEKLDQDAGELLTDVRAVLQASSEGNS